MSVRDKLYEYRRSIYDLMHLITVWTKYVDIVYMPHSMMHTFKAMEEEGERMELEGAPGLMK